MMKKTLWIPCLLVLLLVAMAGSVSAAAFQRVALIDDQCATVAVEPADDGDGQYTTDGDPDDTIIGNRGRFSLDDYVSSLLPEALASYLMERYQEILAGLSDVGLD